MKIGILSRNKNLYSTRRLVEAAQKRGHEAQVIDHAKCYMVMEEGEPSIYNKDHKIEGIDAVIPRIGASVTFYGGALVRQFEMRGTFTTLKSLALLRSRDKLRSLQILSKAGVGIPKTAIARYPGDVDHMLKQLGGPPVIIKLLEGTQGLGVVLAETRKAAKSVIEAFYGLNANILVQEFIKEAKACDIRAFVVDGRVVGAMKRQGNEEDFRSNLHRGGKGTLIRLSKAERTAAVKAAKALGMTIAGVDMLQSEKGPLIIEVNSSPGLEGIEGATGKDIADRVIEHIEKNINKASRAKKDRIGV